MNRKKRAKGIVVEHELLNSKAFRELKRQSLYVLFKLLQRRKMEKVSIGKHKGSWRVINNGEIVFTYKEAAKYGIKPQAFSRAIGQLVAVGFLDIAIPGTGICGATTKFSLSERWQKYGTDEFITVKRKQRIGYKFPTRKQFPNCGKA